MEERCGTETGMLRKERRLIPVGFGVEGGFVVNYRGEVDEQSCS